MTRSDDDARLERLVREIEPRGELLRSWPLVGGISASGGLLQRRFDLPDATSAVLQGLLFVVVLASNTLYGRFRPFQAREA